MPRQRLEAPATPIYSHTIEFRVRYPEADPMGYVHHSRFLQYFEMGRIELLRHLGQNYADLERQGILFVVVRAELHFRSPARYDDVLNLTTNLVKRTAVRFDHTYALKRGDMLLAEGKTTIACVNKAGELIQIPAALQA